MKKNVPVPAVSPEISGPRSEDPVRSLVQVRFPGSIPLSYYNDRYDLRPGDLVYVAGKMAGRIGTVEAVSTRFRIRKSDFQPVLRLLDTEVHGALTPLRGYLVTGDPEVLPPEQFRAWVIPPENPKKKRWFEDPETGERRCFVEVEDDELIVGDGYELSLEALEDSPEVLPVILERAKTYSKEGRVKYVSCREGRFRAYVRGGDWYEVEFSRAGDEITGLYCNCPFPHLCKHALAALLTVRDTLTGASPDGDFTAVEKDWSWEFLSRQPRRITL